MITTEVLYGCQCDRCSEVYEDSNGYQLHADKHEAETDALENGWGELNGKHYCENCHTIDEETDEVIIKSPYPKSVKKVEKFINVIKHKSVDVGETEISFRLTFDIEGWEKCDTNWVLSVCENNVKIEPFISGIRVFANRLLIEIPK